MLHRIANIFFIYAFLAFETYVTLFKGIFFFILCIYIRLDAINIAYFLFSRFVAVLFLHSIPN